MAAISLLDRKFSVYGNRREVLGIYTGPSSYVGGGDSFTPTEVSLGQIDLVVFETPASAVPTCRAVSYDDTNQKVIWFDQAFAEIAGGVDLSSFSCRFRAYGI